MNDENLLQIATKYGTPSYLFDLNSLENRLTAIKEILDHKYELCYAMKANPFLLNFMQNSVDVIEVCSPGELEICINLKINPTKIIYSGVVKAEQDIKRALDFKVDILTAESPNQLLLINRIANEYGIKVNVILRLSAWGQFGMCYSEIVKAFCNADKYTNVNFVGLHYYAGTQRKKMDLIKDDLDKIFRLRSEISKFIKFENFLIEYAPGLGVSKFENDDFNDTLGDLKSLKKILDLYDFKGDIVRIELGRFFVQYCGYYLAKILDVKTTDIGDYVLLNGGINHLNFYGSVMGMKIPIMRHLTTKLKNGSKKDYSICGALCTANDVLARRKTLQNPQIDDLIVFENAGAYSVSDGISLFLSHTLPRILLLQKNKETIIARDFKETFWLNFSNIELKN